MDMNDQVIELASRLFEVSMKNTAKIIYDRIILAKQKSNDKETINALEEIINVLISDKNELIQITQCYEEEFVMQKISDSDIQYITQNIIPLLSRFFPSDSSGTQSQIDALTAILCPESLKIMQLLGFNYKEAIGEPLTKLVAQAIQVKTDQISKRPQKAGYRGT